MVGAILTGAKIAGSLLGNLLANKKSSQQQPVDGRVVADHITLGKGAVAPAPAKANMLDTIGNIANVAGPLIARAGAGAINNNGGLIKAALSTLNDDEWFEKYDGNGATFNELLRAEAQKASNNSRYSVGCLAYGAYSAYHIGDQTAKSFYDNFMSHILAYIRSKTNNILQDNVDSYTIVFANVVKLYEIYYSLLKYREFTLETPSNAPTALTNTVTCFTPENLNVTEGIITNLESYLKATVKLPYALSAYIRWRFGTMFLSTNTKKAGFVSYDPDLRHVTGISGSALTLSGTSCYSITFTHSATADTTPTDLNAAIESIKATLASFGRALSDFATAYQDHDVKYDVEKRHYDEKEFCLRQNISPLNMVFSFGAGTAGYDQIGGWNILMDSRLKMNSAIQSLTISSGTSSDGATPFPVLDNMMYADMNSLNAAAPGVYYAIATAHDTPNHANRIHPFNNNWMCTPGPTSAAHTDLTLVWGQTFSATVYYEKIITALQMSLATSLELHNANFGIIDIFDDSTDSSNKPRFQIAIGTLSFDRARISSESKISIQRNAMLNLVRGDYKRKVQLDITDDATKIVDNLTSKSVSVTEEPVKV